MTLLKRMAPGMDAKALLAALPPDEVRAMLAGVRLEAATPRTITQLDDLARAAREAGRARGRRVCGRRLP